MTRLRSVASFLNARAEALALAWARTPRLARLAIFVLGMTLVVVVPLALRVAWEGQAELQAAERAAAAGDTDREIEHLGRAARWRLGFASHDDEALDRLLLRGHALEASGERAAALAAFREVRGAILATRALDIPHPDLLRAANEAIARLMAEQERRFGTDLSGRGDPEGYHLELLSKVPGPDPLRSHLAAFAFLGWIVSTVLLMLRAFDGHGALRRGPALRMGLISTAWLIAWTILLRYAGP